MFVLEQILIRPGEHHLAALFSSLGSEIDDMIAFFNDLRVMLDDDHRILIGAQALQNLDETATVARVETDGRLVEDVKRIDE